jgi:hypothetical protein
VDGSVRRHERNRFLVVLDVIPDAERDLVEDVVELADQLLHSLKLQGSALGLLLVEPGDSQLRGYTGGQNVAERHHYRSLFVPIVLHGTMTLQYAAVRSNADKNLHVIFRAGEFEGLPHRIRCLGPWQGLTGGEIERLKALYRLQLAAQGFAVVYQHLASFAPEKDR